MTIVLAIETSTAIASIALRIDGEALSREVGGIQRHSEWLLPTIQTLLNEAGITLKRCDALAFGAGPGSFTGVRMACGIVQGMAFGSELPVAPVGTLLAVGVAAHLKTGANDVLVILDARMGEVYWAQYRFSAGVHEWIAIIEPTLSTPSVVKAVGPVVVCGDGLNAYANLFVSLLYIDSLPELMPHALEIALLGQRMLIDGAVVPAREAQPLYLRNHVALTIAERHAKAQRIIL
jgi:tRNA threonylcarbamoyladenosine biosynthesis protein TsaB